MSIHVRTRRQPLTPRQREAIREAMRTLVDEDLDRGATSAAVATCAACSRSSVLVGSVVYDGVRLCNGCATEYELRRAEGSVESIEEFIREAAS